MSYDKQQIIDEFQEYYNHSFDAKTFYRDAKAYMNRRGNTKDTKEPYTEIIISLMFQLGIIERLKKEITTVRRDNNTYHVLSHFYDEFLKPHEKSTQKEKMIAKKLNGNTYEDIGHVLNYEVPLYGKNSDDGGEIDLFSYNEKKDTAFILELKKPDAPDTLLRCIMEVYNYWSRVDRVKLLRDFSLSPDTSVTPAVLVFKDSVAANEYDSLYDRPNLKYLIETMGIQVFIWPIDRAQY